MSWDQYLESMKVDTVTDAGIFGLDGSVWATTDGLKDLTLDQIKILMGDAAPMFCSGPMIGKRKCRLINDSRKDTDQLCLHLKTAGENNPQTGAEENKFICVSKSEKAVVLLFGSGPPNKLTSPVFKMVKFLKESGY